ncbi:hypothetical protein [Ectothiorhodospira lacustris]|uniref:hypothetical protein n=1 Tax=Ectothiorhodospira lacustris TaxID=2899127 RepID=UPI001EE8A52C|nr:hypothetical protein [Ectothiorhodospira lacustris]MCG5502091.1 hypothetical protein [Ectothiorhodospira lacustris]
MASVESTHTGRGPAYGADNPLPYNARNESQSSGVSWPAVAAGAFVAAALALSFVVLGTGLGFSFVSPWPGEGVSARGIGIAGIIWLILMHIIAGAMGGYVAGRLRTRWTNLSDDEVFFRDTAHGLLVWAVSLVITAALLVAVSMSVINSTAQAGATAAGAAVTAGGAAVTAGVDGRSEGGADGPIGYFADALFRQDRAGATPDFSGLGATSSDGIGAGVRAEAVRILAQGREGMPDADRAYLARLISQNTGITQSQAESRINEVQARMAEMEMQAREAADTARKVMVHFYLWMFLGLLLGAFSASFAATIGGRQRDNVQHM